MASYDSEKFGHNGTQFEDVTEEKRNGMHSPTGEDDELFSRFSKHDEKSLMRRVDLRLIPIAGAMYCVSLLDRTNLSNAAIAGMNVELEMVEEVNGVDRYSVVTLLFFITYVLFQPPATIMCRKTGPRMFLSTITLLWGSVMIGMGFVESWVSLAVCRVILGILEAGFFPGVVYLLSTWYTRYEVGKRYAAFYLIGCVASAFGGILAFGLIQMEGVAGFLGWRWIFIIEGILTVVVAALGFLFLRAFPDNTASRSLKFMSEAERLFIIARVNRDRGDATVEKFNIRKWLASGTDWKIWLYATIFGCITTVSYALAYFLPQILEGGLGYDVGTAQCLIAPPYVWAGIMMMATGWWGDRYHMRGPMLVLNATMAIIGTALMGFSSNDRVRYFGVFFATSGANANIPVAMTYQANNIRGQWKRAFCSATLVGFGALGGIVGSTVFRTEDRPDYVPGLSVAMGAQVLIIACVAVLTLDFWRQNAKADRGEKLLENADKNFRYTY